MSRPRNRTEDLSPAALRKRKSRGVKEVEVVEGDPMTIAVAEAAADWHPYAAAVYRSLIDSPVTRFWASSDFMLAHVACEMYSRVLGQGQRPSADMMRVVTQILSSLGADERSRRDMGIELNFEGEELTPEMQALWDEFEAEDEGTDADPRGRDA